MSWTAEAEVGGIIAGVGQDLMNRAAQKVVTDLFESMRSKMEKTHRSDSLTISQVRLMAPDVSEPFKPADTVRDSAKADSKPPCQHLCPRRS